MYSKDSFTGGCYVSFVPAQNNLPFMIGLNADPTTDASFGSIDYALYCKSDGTLDIYSSGVLTVAGVGSYSAGDVLAVTYNGYRFVFSRNGAELSTITNAAFATVNMYADSSFYSVGAKVSALSFGPMSKVSSIATGQILDGAATAHNPYHSASTFLDMPNGDVVAEVTVPIASALSIRGPTSVLTVSGHVTFGNLTNSTTPPWYYLESYFYIDGSQTPSGVSPPLNVYNQGLVVMPPQAAGAPAGRISIPVVMSVSGLSAGTHSLSVLARILVPSSHPFGTTSNCDVMPQLLIVENKL